MKIILRMAATPSLPFLTWLCSNTCLVQATPYSSIKYNFSCYVARKIVLYLMKGDLYQNLLMKIKPANHEQMIFKDFVTTLD